MYLWVWVVFVLLGANVSAKTQRGSAATQRPAQYSENLREPRRFSGSVVQRIAIVVGNNIGTEDEEPLKYAENEALEVYKILIEIGGINPNHAYLALGKNRHELLKIIEEVRQRISDIQEGGEVLLFFYYSGHASPGSIHLLGTSLEMKELKKQLQMAGAQTMIAFVDACKSGAIIRRKGIKVMPAYELQIESREAAAGRVFITSSGPSEVSMEAEELRGSYFSHYLISGLRGDADGDKDGRIDLDEIYKYTYHNTVAKTAESEVGTQHPGFDYDLRGSGDVVITWPEKSQAGVILGPELAGTYLIITKYSRKVIAEVTKAGGESKNIALPAQSYIIKKRVKGGYAVGEVNLTWGGRKKLDEASMEFLSYKAVISKGALPALEYNEIFLFFVTRNGAVEGNRHLLGGALTYRRTVSDKIKLGATLIYETGETTTQDFDVPTHGFALGVDCLYIEDLGKFQLNVGGYLGGIFLWQEIPGWENHQSLGSMFGVIAGIVWIPADPIEVMIEVRAGLDYLKKGDDYQLGPELQADLGVGLRF